MGGDKKIYVVGAGLAGMVAAINLARADYQVTVLEAEATIGGSSYLHPSLHITPINREKTWQYIGINLDDCFTTLGKFPIYLGDHRHQVFGQYFCIVERGSRPTSVDTRLYKLAVKEGVAFTFSTRVDKVDDLHPNTIIATGLDPRMFKVLGLPYRDIPSRHVYQDTERERYGLGIFSEYASEYFYAAANNHLFYAMLPLEDPPNLNHLTRLVHDLKEWEEIHIPERKWRPVVFRVPLGGPANLRLFHGDRILAGTIGGMMDPFFLFGIHGAMVSGKVAALTVMDPEQGRAEFARVNRYFHRTFRAKQLYQRLPVKARLALFNAFARTPYLFSPMIRLISRGIPGHDDPEFFYRSFVGPDYNPPAAFRMAASMGDRLATMVRFFKRER